MQGIWLFIPDGCLYLCWEFEDCFVKHLEQTSTSNHYGPWHSHDSAPKMGLFQDWRTQKKQFVEEMVIFEQQKYAHDSLAMAVTVDIHFEVLQFSTIVSIALLFLRVALQKRI